jgi:predicted O-linked N-acetylglucosamine transferase (SPINDLY family)
VAQGQHALALQAFQKAAQLDGKLANVFARIGDAHCALYEYDAAELNYEHAMRLDPSDSELLVGYAISQFWQGKLTNAEQSLHQVVQKHPQHARALTLLAGVYEKLGQLDRVSAFYERALAVQPEDALTNSNYLFFLAYQSQLPPEDYLSQAKLWALRTLQPGQRQWAKEQAKRRKWQLLNRVGRRLRVGYVSGDFRQHAVATFIERLFAQHDTNRIELFAYCANTYSDDVTQRIRQLVDYWHSVGHLTDEALHALIETHEIDVLIDLSGHTAHNRLGVFARRAAPVQATYLGYFASTGLSEMDFWIADEVLVPSDHTSHFVESVWRLPRLWASYNGRSDAPAVIERNTVLRPMTIGCFNNLSKISLESLNLWALILRELVGAKLILKAEALDDLANRKRVADVLLAHGVAAHRFELIGSATSWFDYMALFNQLDVALDPVGSHSGVTTTCDALWMGVPVVTLAGNRLSQRHSASLLAALGRDSWVAESHAQYVKSVISLAQNCESHHRAVQREHMRQSTLCDAKGLAVALENAFETMFDQRVQCNFLAAP